MVASIADASSGVVRSCGIWAPDQCRKSIHAGIDADGASEIHTRAIPTKKLALLAPALSRPRGVVQRHECPIVAVDIRHSCKIDGSTPS